jgi:hypothetical protein
MSSMSNMITGLKLAANDRQDLLARFQPCMPRSSPTM